MERTDHILEFNQALLNNFKLKTKILLSFFSVILFFQIISLTYGVTQTDLIGREVPVRLVFVGPALLLSIIIGEILMIRFLNQSIKKGTEIKPFIVFLITFLEVSFPTLVMGTIGSFTDFESTMLSTLQLLNSPLFLVYFLMIILSSLLLNFRLCVFAGVVAGIEFSLLNLFYLLNKVDTVDLMSNVFKSVFIILAGVVAALVSKKIREAITSELSAKSELINTLDIKVQEKTQEVVSQKNEIEKKNHLLTEKNKEITDSITYAKRLQEAILPAEQIIKEHLPDSFIFYKPKDIVAGDFYWMETIQCANMPISQLANYPSPNQLILFAAADCTGHGVPGAMVSVVCHNALNRSVKEFGLTDPGKILDKTRELVVETFTKSNADVKDGMDISLCSIRYQVEERNSNFESSISKVNAVLQWAGANNPLWVVRAPRLRSATEPSQHYLQEIKPDKQPIGKSEISKPFTTHTLELQKGDTIYLFTDGFADQFGGEKGKKFMYKPLKELLLKNASVPMEEQAKLLEDALHQWTNTTHNTFEQVDDICIIGIRI